MAAGRGDQIRLCGRRRPLDAGARVMAALAYDLLDRRALAALRFVDATGAQVVTPVAVSADGAKFVRTRSGLAAVLAAPGLEAHESAFQAPPAAPAIGSVTVELDVRPA